MSVPVYPQTAFAKCIFKRLYEMRKTRQAFSEEVGISLPTLNAYAQMKRFPTYGTLCRLAEALELDVDYLADLITSDKEALRNK